MRQIKENVGRGDFERIAERELIPVHVQPRHVETNTQMNFLSRRAIGASRSHILIGGAGKLARGERVEASV